MEPIGCVQHDCDDYKKRALAPTPSARTYELAMGAANDIMTKFANISPAQIHAQVQVIVQRAIEAGQRREVSQSVPAEDFCFCDENVSLQMVSGGGSKEGYLGKVVLRIGGEYRDYFAQPARQVNDPQTDRKANDIMARGYQLTGYVMRHPETMQRVIIESSAVRWAQAEDMYEIMFPQNRQPREVLTNERIQEIAIETQSAEPGRDGYVLPLSFARAIEAEINGVKS